VVLRPLSSNYLGNLKRMSHATNRRDESGSSTAAGGIRGEIKIHVKIHHVFLLATVKIMEWGRRKCTQYGRRSIDEACRSKSDIAIINRECTTA